MKRGFTLMEVNLAIFIMATGILSMVSLYSLGFRESSQSREDVAGAALADAVMGPLVMACSDTSVKWSQFKEEWQYPTDGKGWGHYLNEDKGIVVNDPDGDCRTFFGNVLSKMKNCGAKNVDASYPSNGNGLSGALVVSHAKDSGVVKIAFRATAKPGQLLSQPMYYTEVRFQGIVDQ